MIVIKTIEEMRSFIGAQKKEGQTIGFVPTMGALHDGHLQLVRHAKKQSDCVIVSIFVNPLQFAAHEDLGTYPRTEEQDCALLQAENVDAVFMPDADIMYKNKDRTVVTVGNVSTGMEGDYRPHFFAGVATIVTKLFMIVQPDYAFFGEKDYQQLCVITALCDDLNIPVQVIPVPTVREESGLALSSRNRYLSPGDYKTASVLYEVLRWAAFEWRNGETITGVVEQARKKILQAGFHKIDYFLFWDVKNWCLVADDEGASYPQNARIFVAATLGTTRLIDNISCESV